MNYLLRQLYFGLIAILMLSELFASNLFGLLFTIDRAAQVMGVSVEMARSHTTILAVLDAFPGVGAVLVLWARRRAKPLWIGRCGVALTTMGMLAYGCYQFWFASTHLEDIQLTIKSVGVAYGFLGLGAWFAGSDLMRGQESLVLPEQSVES